MCTYRPSPFFPKKVSRNIVDVLEKVSRTKKLL